MSSLTRRLWPYFRVQERSYGAGFFFLLLTNLCAAGVPLAVKNAIETLEQQRQGSVLWWALVVIVLALLGAGFRVASRLAVFNAGRRVENDLRNDLFRRLLSLGPAYFAHRPTGDLVSRMTNDIASVRLLAGFATLNLANTLLVYVAVSVPMMLINTRLALVTLAPVPVLFLAARLIGKRIYRHSLAAAEDLGRVSNQANETITGRSVIHAYALEDLRQEHFEGASTRSRRSNIRLAIARTSITPLLGWAGGLAKALLFVIGGLVIVEGARTKGEVAAFLFYLDQLMWPTLALGWVISVFQRGQAAMERLLGILDAEAQVQGAVGATDQVEDACLEFRGLSAERGGRTVLREVNLRVNPGELVALLGPTGCGKTTLLEQVPHTMPVVAGTLFVGGREIDGWSLAALRKALGIVPQESFLFSDTLRNNVLFGRPEATDEEVWEALRVSDLVGTVEGFPEGLDTVVGERGISLSGGQRQRVAIARAAILRPRLWLLDDSLSAVDVLTEARILEALMSRGGDSAVLMVTHRVTGLDRADRIYVMEDGAIVEVGTHQELLEAGAYYARLVREQSFFGQEVDRARA